MTPKFLFSEIGRVKERKKEGGLETSYETFLQKLTNLISQFLKLITSHPKVFFLLRNSVMRFVAIFGSIFPSIEAHLHDDENATFLH